MPSPKTASDDDDSSSDPSESTCRLPAPNHKPDNAPATPKNQRASAGQTPKTTPAAPAPSPGPAVNRRRRLSQSQKTQPTLLTDFFLGRQSPARIEAQRRKNKNLDASAVKAEVRTAMRQSSVMRLQQPGGVRDRVKAWQKTNAAAIASGDPESAPSEPTDVAFGEDDKSVTEDDRLRIRARQRQKAAKPPAAKPSTARHEYPKTDGEDNSPGARQKTTKNRADPKGVENNEGGRSKSDYGDARDGGPKYYSMKVPKGRMDLPDETSAEAGTPPKKRIVSDQHWMKRGNRTSPKTRNAKTKPVGGPPMPLPKDFLQRTAQNPTVQNKIKDWAKRVEPPSPAKPSHRDSRRERAQAREDGSDGESDATQKPAATSWRSAPDDGIRVRPLRSTRSAGDGQAKTTQRGPKASVRRKRQDYDDGIHVRPASPNESAEDRIEVFVSEDEGTAAPSKKKIPADDGIRVRPITSSTPSDSRKAVPGRRPVTAGSQGTQSASYGRPKARSPVTYTISSAPTADSGQSVTEEQQSSLHTPTRKPAPKPRTASKEPKTPLRKARRSPARAHNDEATNPASSWYEGSEGSRSGSESGSGSGDRDGGESVADSYGPSTVPPKSLADIPVGFSAFSELDLPINGEAGRGRSRTARNPSFKGVPHILKKVVSEGKKMVHEKVGPPRPVLKQPPSIENWLNSTVDPFVEATPARKVSSAQARQSTETRWKKDAQRRSTSETRKRPEEPSPTRAPRAQSQERSAPIPDGKSDLKHHATEPAPKTTPAPAKAQSSPTARSRTPGTPEAREAREAREAPKSPEGRETPETSETPEMPATPNQKTTPTNGLKRSGATRSPSSPLKSGNSKKPFRDLLRDAFRGESGVHKPLISNPSYELGRDRDRDRDRHRDGESEDSHEDRFDSRRTRRRSSGDSSKSGTAPTMTESAVDSGITESSSGSSSFVSSATPSSGLPRRRPPPTNGDHELSTIVSVESFSTHPSDTMSTISESTVTQGTTFTGGATGGISRRKATTSQTGLKRRLTKHSDLVSVLSLPEDSRLPERTKSIRLARSLHRKTSKLDNATLDDLLREFAEDESLYRRELRTLVSGVVPVLLSQFVPQSGESRATDIFGADLAAGQKMKIMSRAVVDMGVALEKLNLLHQFVPIKDAARMVDWLEKVYPVYDNYLDVWRLGFQGIIVNLAPAAGKSAEEDSLVNGMERNEDGDVLDENGERVDVAYLLRRPLVRIKWMLKFAKGVQVILGRGVAGDVPHTLEALHEKARRRNREEIARKTDEDASTTDTTRARDLRNMAILDKTNIDQTRQVSAKDWFDLSLSHSNGQRLECQVELIFRDKISDPSDRGDVLIRETGSAGRSWLLFPPLSLSKVSARKGQDSRTLVVMIRDVHMGREWYELVTLVAEHEDTADDWQGILGSSPLPPPTTGRTSLSQALKKHEEADVPLGERKFSAAHEAKPDSSTAPRTPETPVRYRTHQRTPSTPATRSPLNDNDRTPTNTASENASPSDAYPTRNDASSHPIRESMRPDPAQLKKSAMSTSPRNDGAPPPPPAHRTPITKPAPILSPPAELNMATTRIRRRTSSPLKHEYHPSDISSDSDSTSQSSGSESDSSSDGLEEDDVPDTLPGISIKAPTDLGAAESVISESSITPSNSASQAGMPGLRASYPSEYNLQLMASISYWSNRKGAWKNLGEPLSAIVITPGLIEAYLPGTNVTGTQHGPGFTSTSTVELEAGAPRPLIALDLTPVVMIRQSTVVDLEIRSPVRSFSKYNHLDANIFRFRAQSPAELINLYSAVHQSRMNNAKFKALEEEARFRSFGQPQNAGEVGDDTSSRRRRSWFGRKNSYRASARAPSQSQGSSSSISATSFLRRLTGGGNMSFNIHGSSVDRQSRAGSGGASFYTSSGSSSAGGGGFSVTVPRSPSVSLAESSNRGIQALGSSNIKMRCHLQMSANKWEDNGNCLLTIARPPPGVRQELTIYHGLEKRVLVVSIPKKANDKPLVVVDVVVGSACFSRLAARGIVLNVWEEMRDEQNRVGSATATGAISGRVRKWCFQFSSAAVASWVFGLVASEVEIA